MAWSANRFGRKKTVAVGFFWLVLGTGLQTGAQNPAMFVVGRLCIGGVSAFFSAAPILITETAFPTHRAIATAFFNCGWYVGGLIAAWSTYGTRNYDSDWSWRIPSLLQMVVPVAAVFGFWLSPESPRWLVSVGRQEEARSILTKYHAGGDINSPLVAYEFEEITRTLEIEKETLDNVSYLDLFKTKGRRHRSMISITLGIFAQWNGGMYLRSTLNLYRSLTQTSRNRLILPGSSAFDGRHQIRDPADYDIWISTSLESHSRRRCCIQR